MPVFVIAPLLLQADDRTRIAMLRRDYDPHAELVEPHVTLISALDDRLEAEAVRWARFSAQNAATHTLPIIRAVVARDYEKSSWYAFLLPKSIPPQLTMLYRNLHGGPVRRTPDTSFDAHVTVGRFQERVIAEAVARELNEDGVRIDAAIESLAVLRFDGTSVCARTVVSFGG
ncbi:MAG TPA: 2'-5' RNA ligase family protein [Dongiaceae bacterium]|jgi:2'-5' RNA ligase